MTPRLAQRATARRNGIALVALTLATALPAEAQRAREEAQLAEERSMLERRGREVLHPGEALQLVGVGAGDPDVLTHTPALASATLGLARVDRQELYARKLAMYDGTAHFDDAPRTLAPGALAVGRDGQRRATSTGADSAPAGADSVAAAWPWIAAAAAALALYLRRTFMLNRAR